jgi:hypothetical protein
VTPRLVRINQSPPRFSIRKTRPRLITPPRYRIAPRAQRGTALPSIEGRLRGIGLGEYPSRFVENDRLDHSRRPCVRSPVQAERHPQAEMTRYLTEHGYANSPGCSARWCAWMPMARPRRS